MKTITHLNKNAEQKATSVSSVIITKGDWDGTNKIKIMNIPEQALVTTIRFTGIGTIAALSKCTVELLGYTTGEIAISSSVYLSNPELHLTTGAKVTVTPNTEMKDGDNSILIVIEYIEYTRGIGTLTQY